MRNLVGISIALTLLLSLSGCSEKESFTILFTGDDQGRLVPSG
jgi:hypothetical protein